MLTHIKSSLILVLIVLATFSKAETFRQKKNMKDQKLRARSSRAGQSGLVTAAVKIEDEDEENAIEYEASASPKKAEKEEPTKPEESDDLFKGFDGSKFDFQGKAGGIFNLISDSDFQLNAQFVKSSLDKRNYMDMLGFQLGSSSVMVLPDIVMINNHIVQDGVYTVVVNENGDVSEHDVNSPGATTGKEEGMIHVDGREIAISTEGWTVVAKTMNTHNIAHLNIECSCHSDYLKHPHGVLGQSAQFLLDGSTPKPKEYDPSKTMGEGIIEGQPNDYEVEDGPFGTEFKFNRFGVDTRMAVNLAPPRFARGAANYKPIDIAMHNEL